MFFIGIFGVQNKTEKFIPKRQLSVLSAKFTDGMKLLRATLISTSFLSLSGAGISAISSKPTAAAVSAS